MLWSEILKIKTDPELGMLLGTRWHEIQSQKLRISEIPESSVAVEINAQAHEEKGSGGKNGLPQSESEAGACTKRPWQFVHSTTTMQSQFLLMLIQSQSWSSKLQTVVLKTTQRIWILWVWLWIEIESIKMVNWISYFLCYEYDKVGVVWVMMWVLFVISSAL